MNDPFIQTWASLNRQRTILEQRQRCELMRGAIIGAAMAFACGVVIGMMWGCAL